MNLTFAPRDILQFDDARIVYRNFSGTPSKYNREGDRNFAVVINDEETANALIAEGWNVKIKPPREDGDDPFIILPVKVKFNERGPNVYLSSNGNQIKLDETTVSCLDDVTIQSVDLDVRPFDWVIMEGTADEKRGRTAYLQAMRVTQELDRFASSYGYDD